MDGIPVDSVGLKEVSIRQKDKLECVEKFCYLGDIIGSGGGSEEAARAIVRCAWAKFRNLSPILTASERKNLQGLCAKCFDIWQ